MKKATLAPMLLLAVLVIHGCRSLEPHADLLVSARVAEPEAKVTITYLGCNGFLIRSGSTSLLVDPCFTRPGMLRVGLNRPIPPSEERIASGIERGGLPGRVDAILVTHAHYDHLLDVPALQAQLGGTIIASPTGCFTARAHGTSMDQVDPVLPGAWRKVGAASIQVIEAAHDRLLGRVPMQGRYLDVPQRVPTRAREYLCGQPLAFLIEIGGRRIYVDSGGRPDLLPPRIDGGVDLALIGAALPDSQQRFVAAVERLQPRLVYPSHQDNFFRSVDRPYRFNLGVDFPALRREFEAAATDAELILFEFFETLRL